MSLIAEESSLLTTRQAAELVGRTPETVKNAVRTGYLPGRQIDGFWRLKAADVLAWDARAPRYRNVKKRAHERSAELLAEYGSLTPYELSTFQGVHVGNARKYLCLLAVEGRAHRHGDGEWFPGLTCASCPEEVAS
jgi:hypothetical protein